MRHARVSARLCRMDRALRIHRIDPELVFPVPDSVPVCRRPGLAPFPDADSLFDPRLWKVTLIAPRINGDRSLMLLLPVPKGGAIDSVLRLDCLGSDVASRWGPLARIEGRRLGLLDARCTGQCPVVQTGRVVKGLHGVLKHP